MNTATDTITYPARLSLPLSEKERGVIIDLKATLQKERRTLKEFVWSAIEKEMALLERDHSKRK